MLKLAFYLYIKERHSIRWCVLFLEQTCSVGRHDEREAGAGGVTAGAEVVAATSRCAQRGGEARAAAVDEAEAEQADARVPAAGGGQA